MIYETHTNKETKKELRGPEGALILVILSGPVEIMRGPVDQLLSGTRCVGPTDPQL